METLEKLVANKEALESAIEHIDLWLLIFGLIVAVGVVGEFVYGFKAWRNNQKLHVVQQSIDQLRQTEIAHLNSDNLKLRIVNLPRSIVLMDRNGDKKEREARRSEVNKYSGTTAYVRSVSDREPQQLAASIIGLLKESKWNVMNLGPSIPPGPLTSGVRIMTREASMFLPNGQGLANPKEYKYSEISKAAQSLCNLLQLDLGPPYGPAFWGVKWEPEQPDPITGQYSFEFPKDSMFISVGEIPAEFFLPPIPPPTTKEDPNAKQSR